MKKRNLFNSYLRKQNRSTIEIKMIISSLSSEPSSSKSGKWRICKYQTNEWRKNFYCEFDIFILRFWQPASWCKFSLSAKNLRIEIEYDRQAASELNSLILTQITGQNADSVPSSYLPLPPNRNRYHATTILVLSLCPSHYLIWCHVRC